MIKMPERVGLGAYDAHYDSYYITDDGTNYFKTDDMIEFIEGLKSKGARHIVTDTHNSALNMVLERLKGKNND